METCPIVRIRTFQHLEILLILAVGFGFFVHSPSCSSEVSRSNSASDSQNSNIGASSSLKTYVVEPYFEKNEIFLDSNFEDFIAEEHHGTCEQLPGNLDLPFGLSIPQRQLIGEGSHRHLSSIIGFNLQPEHSSQLHKHFCQLVVVEKLPNGVFADPFELQHLLERGVFSDIAVFGDINLELPSVLSNRSVVEIHMNASAGRFLRDKNQLQISIDLPLHARYPPLNDSGYSIVEFTAPDLFMRCSVEGSPGDHSCLFRPTAEGKIQSVSWAIPSGIRAHTGIVSVLTFVTASISTLLIVLTSIRHSNFKSWNNSRQL